MVSGMDKAKRPLERAFELAGSGHCRTVSDIRQTMRKEGYPTDQLVGPDLLRQLRDVIRLARSDL